MGTSLVRVVCQFEVTGVGRATARSGRWEMGDGRWEKGSGNRE
jgi:hypothetical protein